MIRGFKESYRWLSNFWLVPVKFEGIVYPSSENAYQAAKTLDVEKRRYIATLSPADAKRAGKALVLREDWESIKLKVMEAIVTIKFNDNPKLKALLLATGRRLLVEENNWGDKFWGTCDGEGKNHLGRILMVVRLRLRKERDREA